MEGPETHPPVKQKIQFQKKRSGVPEETPDRVDTELHQLILLFPRPSPSASTLRSLPAGVQRIPVHNRVEAKRVCSLRLPTPERTQREHHDVSLPKRRI